MVWFLVDDVLPFHERVIRAGNAAMGLWVRGGAWCSGQLTDGFIPLDVARTMGTPAEIRRLTDVGLWHPDEHDGQAGYRFHAWAEDGTGRQRQPTRAEVEAKRRAERERKAAYRDRQRRDGEGRYVPQGVPVGQTPGHPAGHPPDVPQGVPPYQAEPSQAIEEQERSIERSPSAGPAHAAPAEADRASTELVLVTEPAPARSTYPEAFEAFWRAYPRHEGKRDALRAWQAARRIATGTQILDGAVRYAADPNRDPAFTAHASTWLRRGGWDDEALPRRRPEARSDRQRDAVGRMFEELGASVPGRRGA